jgi:hypothetical protein
MNLRLALRIRLEKAGDKNKTLGAWLDDIKRVDELMRAENANFESIATDYKALTQSFVDLIKKRLGKPLAAVMNTVNDNNTVTASATVPVAAVMGMSRNPAAYMPSNVSSVIEGESDSDLSVSNQNLVAAVANQSPLALTALIEALAPFTVPHLFW